MKKLKALKNFTCNGVRKKAGEFLSENDKEKIGEKLGQKLINDDFIRSESEPKEESSSLSYPSSDDLNEMDKEELMELAKKLGLKHHHNSGEDKIRELIREKLSE